MPRRRHDPQRRDRIVDACLEVIATVGVAGTSHRKVAEAADVPLGSMTYHFSGMDELLREALSRFAQEVGDRFDQRMRRARDRTQALDAVARIITDDVFAAPRDLVLTHELYTLAARDPSFRDITVAWMDRSRAALERHFDPLTARMVDALIEGLTIHSALDSDPKDQAEIREAALRITTLPPPSGALPVRTGALRDTAVDSGGDRGEPSAARSGEEPGEPVPGPPAGGYDKGRQRRTQILRAALKAFGTVGYHQASMVRIAADCGVSRAGLLHHFPTKESLLEAVLTERDRVNGDLFFADQDPAHDGAEYFSRLVRLVEHNATDPGIVSLFAVLSTEAGNPAHPAHAYFRRRYENLCHDVRRALADLDRRGLVRPGVSVEGLEVELVALMDGLQVQWLLDPARVDMADRLRSRLRSVAELPDP
ncbi:TetR family transcriptional regulator [Nocardiopsis sp. CT-R113]|uniref:TetR family transcriptional regulator n=1 Tax=Nocardiopsis codii TaxID=3065942 RepID=A0ABU7KAK8_9ACTN|nr:TetR family transcriptional regulator [Nocardiopsis sp. CT-R113]MEE2039280.1 TetR family transcriptional regulator [Nocardiopsis sp. CT-R113]